MFHKTICLNPIISLCITEGRTYKDGTSLWHIFGQFEPHDSKELITISKIRGTEQEAIDYAEEILGVSLNGNNQDNFLKAYFREELERRGYKATDKAVEHIYDAVTSDEWAMESFYQAMNDAIREEMTVRKEYAVEIHNGKGYVSQLDIFDTEEQAEAFRKGYEAANTLQKDEYTAIITIKYDDEENEVGIEG